MQGQGEDALLQARVRDAPTPAAAAAALRAAVAGVPRSHPSLQLLLLPAVMPLGRHPVRQTPGRRGGASSKTLAPGEACPCQLR